MVWSGDSHQEFLISVVKIVECARCAWQGLSSKLSPEVKADYLRVLIAAGFECIDAVSFASSSFSPESGDAERVLEYLDPPDDVEIIALVVDEPGAERAVATNSVSTLAFPYSISPSFLDRNQHQTPEDALEALEAVATLAYKEGLEVVARMPMAFGNPYGDLWDIDEVVSACDLLVDSGILQISLEDTIGLATATEIARVTEAVVGIHNRVEIGLHLRARPEDAAAKIRAAYRAGCRRFEGTIGGHGKAADAHDLLVTNLPTELLVSELSSLGAKLPVLGSLDTLLAASNGIAAKFGGSPLPM